MRTLLAIALVASCLLCGTSCKPRAKSMLPLVNMTNLVADCQKLAEEGAKLGREFWDRADPLPPTIAALAPQYVHLSIRESATVVDIQFSGGFYHRGYLVVCASKDPNFVPQKGRNWRVTKVAPGVFEYRE